MDKDIIIGLGQVGQALKEVLESKYKLDTFDIKDLDIPTQERYRIAHICFPYNVKFIAQVQKYFRQFRPSVILIHSTLQVGTTQKIIKKLNFKSIVHTPIRGQHDQLPACIKVFTKFLGIDYPLIKIQDNSLSEFLQKYFKELDIHTVVYKNSRLTEMAKMLCLFQYGMHNLVAHESKKMCDQLGLDYNKTMLFWNETYNQGYNVFRTDVRDYKRSILIPNIEDGFGRSCIIPINKMLYNQTKNPMIKQIIKYGQRPNKKGTK